MTQGRPSPRVKICGVRTVDDVETAVVAGTDGIGVICDVPVASPREVSADRARELLAAVPPFVTGTLVTMPDSADRVCDLVGRVGADAVQIHGGLDPDEVATVGSSIHQPVLYAVASDALESVHQYDSCVDALVVDTATESGAGGTGRTHDWNRTREATDEVDSPVVLAGGLTPENVAEAIEIVSPFAVDVAGGVESVPGVKDPARVRAFVDRVTETGASQIAADVGVR